MTKKQLKEKEIQDYLNHEPENIYLTVEEFLEKFKDFDDKKYNLNVGTTFMWNNNIITLVTGYGKKS